MKSVAVPLLAIVLASSLGCGPARVTVDDEPKPSPWSPPRTTLPKAFVEETAFRLAHGSGDPRGKSYGSAFVQLGGAWRWNDKPTEVHGWLSKEEPRRIVSLGGFVYDVVSPGQESGSLEADVRSFERAAIPASKTWMVPLDSDPESFVRMLLVVGRPDLARLPTHEP